MCELAAKASPHTNPSLFCGGLEHSAHMPCRLPFMWSILVVSIPLGMRSSVLIYRTDQYPVLKPVTDATLCISQNSDVQTLDLSANGLGSSGAKALVPQVASFSAMQVLDLAANDIGADGAQCLAPYLAGMARLQKLNLDANSIGVDGVQAIAQSLPLSLIHI